MENSREGTTSIYVFVVAFLGIFGGAIVGMVLDAFVAADILIGLLTGILGVAAAGIVRVLIKRHVGATAIDKGMAAFPRIVWVNAILSAAVSGLAGHDLSHEMGESSPAIIGGLSGLFATILMISLMSAYFYGYSSSKDVGGSPSRLQERQRMKT